MNMDVFFLFKLFGNIVAYVQPQKINTVLEFDTIKKEMKNRVYLITTFWGFLNLSQIINEKWGKRIKFG